MSEIFNKEEESRLSGIIEDYRKIYENATYLAVQMEKMEEEMKVLIKNMDDLKEEEMGMYVNASERSGEDINEVKKAAADIIIKAQTENNFSTTETIKN